jgi:hypothetical protein
MGLRQNLKTGTKFQLTGWFLLVLIGTWRFWSEDVLEASWSWIDGLLALPAALALALIVFGYSRNRQEDDRKRARFL